MSFSAIKTTMLLCLCGIAAATTELLTGAAQSQVTMMVQPAGIYRITGTIEQQSDGKPVTGLTVKVFNDSGTGAPLARSTTDADGKYELSMDRALLPAALQANELQKFVIRVFNSANQVIKSPEQQIEMTSDTDARVEFQLPPSVLQQVQPFICGYGKDATMSRMLAGLSERELSEVFRSFRSTGKAASELNASQRAVLQRLPREYNPNTCLEGHFSSFKSNLEKRGERKLDRLKRALIAPLDKVFSTEHFRILYTLEFPGGVNGAVPEFDSPLKMPNGELIGYIRANVGDLPGNKTLPPTQVQEVGLIAEHALKRFTEAPFNLRSPVAAGQKLDIYIQDIPAAGATDPDPEVNWIQINNHNSTSQNFGTVPHELFHRVQYEYNRTSNRSGLYGVMREGGARFIEDSFNDDYNRYVFESRKIFLEPAFSLLTPPESCSTPINYAAALFWKYLAEQVTQDTSCNREPDIGVDSYRQVLEATAGGPTQPYDVVHLRAACLGMTRPASFDEFRYLDGARTELESSETVWGNYLIANYVHSTDLSPFGERRFQYLEDHELVTWPLIQWDDDEKPIDVRRLTKLGVSIKPYNNLQINRGSSISRTIIGHLPFAATYYRITPGTSSGPRALRVSLSGFGGLNDPLVQILSFGPDGILSDISRSDRVSYARTINLSGLSGVVVIVASRAAGGDYTLKLEEVEGGADPMITRWNSGALTEYEIDPRNDAWNFKSPDLTIQDNDGLPADRGVVFAVDNKLHLRLHNRGNSRAGDVQIDLRYQTHKSRLYPDHWLPLCNSANVVQTLSGLTVEAGDKKDVTVDWSPSVTSGQGWCVKATITAPGDLNGDNNVAIGCFAESKVAVLKSVSH